jgi:beta-glucanase (GH16 family)
MPPRRLSLAAVVLLLSLPSLALSASDPTLIDDFTPYPYLWKVSPSVSLDNPEILAGDPLALPGQGASERVLQVTGPIHASVDVNARACRIRHGIVSAVLTTTPNLDVRDVDARSVRLGHTPAFHAQLRPQSQQRRHHQVVPTELVLLFRGHDACEASRGDDPALAGRTHDGRFFASGGPGARLVRPYVASSDWSLTDGLRFWYYGRNTGDLLKLELRDNRQPDPGPSGWRLVWSDEFNGPAGQPFDAGSWTPETGDGCPNGICGWGNNEREYYTGNAENVALDGAGNLAISVQRADGSLSCYYGPCEYTSARLVSQDKVEIGHGRIEARIKVPAGKGLWPAFWALGSNIGQVGWPNCGEIDMMEHVAQNPTQIFATVHGPGYSGGSGIGSSYDLGVPVADAFHVFAFEWQKDRLDWYLDGTLYNTVTRAQVGGNPWVFDKPFFMIMNVAIGGWLGGDIDPTLSFPRSMLVDYIRVYAAPDTAERFEASFSDNATGWQEVELPWDSFVRSAAQPHDAPNDGLTLSEVWGYGFRLPGRGLVANPLYLDKVRTVQPLSYVVENANDSGPGSLREGVLAVANDGVVSFDPSLAGATITLASGPIWISGKSVTVDATAVPGITLQGAGGDRLLIVDPGASGVVRGLSFANGFGWTLGGAMIINGRAELDHVVVRNNTAMTDAPDWWKGGGGIYVGDNATLVLRDSTVRDNVARLASGAAGECNGGGIFATWGSSVTIERSTISGNSAANVGGGIRFVGSATIVDSTISGNTTQGWNGSAIFLTDGVVHVVNSTIVDNTVPAGQGLGAIFVGTFGGGSATLTMANTILAQNAGGIGCFYAPWGSGAVTLTSVGNNVYGDATCFPVGSDQVVGSAGVSALADNGGPTATHALLPGSPAIDMADAALCPATDQRGVARPQGAGCDVGSFELVP